MAPLARLNVGDGMATPQAQSAYEEFFATLGGKPVHHTLANHWARVVEMIYAAERMLELVDDPNHRPRHPHHADGRSRGKGLAWSKPRAARCFTTTRPTRTA